MVLPLLTLPEELQAHFVLLLTDVMTAGRLARSSRTCKRLVQHRLAALVEAKRNELREAAASKYGAGTRRAAICAHFERLDAATHIRYRCWCPRATPAGAAEPATHRPCAIVLVDHHGRGLPVNLVSHLRRYHQDIIQIPQ